MNHSKALTIPKGSQEQEIQLPTWVERGGWSKKAHARYVEDAAEAAELLKRNPALRQLAKRCGLMMSTAAYVVSKNRRISDVPIKKKPGRKKISNGLPDVGDARPTLKTAKQGLWKFAIKTVKTRTKNTGEHHTTKASALLKDKQEAFNLQRKFILSDDFSAVQSPGQEAFVQEFLESQEFKDLSPTMQAQYHAEIIERVNKLDK